MERIICVQCGQGCASSKRQGIIGHYGTEESPAMLKSDAGRAAAISHYGDVKAMAFNRQTSFVGHYGNETRVGRCPQCRA